MTAHEVRLEIDPIYPEMVVDGMQTLLGVLVLYAGVSAHLAPWAMVPLQLVLLALVVWLYPRKEWALPAVDLLIYIMLQLQLALGLGLFMVAELVALIAFVVLRGLNK